LIHIIVIAEARLDQALPDHLIERRRIVIAGPGPGDPSRYPTHAKAIFHLLDAVPGVVLELGHIGVDMAALDRNGGGP